jgi:hypothetical protein
MWFKNRFRNWLTSPRTRPVLRPQPPRRQQVRPQLEELEERLTPANIIDVANGDVQGLINAINYANSDTGPDTISLASNGTYTLTAVNNSSQFGIGTGLPVITAANLTINGNGATIQRSSAPETPGFDIFLINSGTTNLNDMTITGGSSASYGGGVLLAGSGTLNLTDSTVSGNTAYYEGGGLALVSTGSATITNSTIADNSYSDPLGDGGGIFVGNNALIENSTIADNTGADSAGGGGIEVSYSNPTFGGNATLVNSIVAGNTNTAGGSDVVNFSTVNATNSLIQNLAPGTINGTNVNNIVLTDPQLGPLQNNGGNTDTMAITTSSPAFAAGDPSLVPSGVTTDQRGLSRVVNGQLDMGAFQIQAGYLTMSPISVPFSSNSQNITLSATVTAQGVSSVNEGHVTFHVLGQTLTAAVSNGVANTTLTLPGGTALGAYPMQAVYSDSSPDPGNLCGSVVNSSLTVASAPVTTTAASQSVFYNAASQPFTLTATVTDPADSSDLVNEGTVTFTIEDSGGHVVGIPVSAPVQNLKAFASYIVPPGLVPGAYYNIVVSYKDAAGNYSDGGDQNNILTVNPAVVTTTAEPPSVSVSHTSRTIALGALVKDQSFPNSTINEGTVLFSVLDSSGNLIGAPVQGTVTSGFASAAFAVPAGVPAGSYTIEASYSDASGNFVEGSGVATTLAILQDPPASVSDPPAAADPPAPSAGISPPPTSNPTPLPPPPASSQQQALFQLFLDGFELELETLLGQSTAATQADINNLLPFAGPFGAFFESAGQLALVQA